ncbi:Multidrug resistance efflux transporter EmrE [Glarea lozoyensis ATCC 20868]|uniref:Multidrug resistance efflux transporter EmrE n=1 Tax=Glarea lozoyensis (strain ATCC 20868 / MF5171) TaxID=1116229 RepID=S3DEB2_GLAL2|nr:Multidrug resistance efflux transporter EmrE [Glarea lozoyensis ATCC 20868]EPE36100.1 Multidrug resistance efflux transporter EmrE [Glarea lozoyensis ATCC 20868]
MALDKMLIPFLVAMMLVTGVCNTLLTKYQDNICVRDCEAKHPKDRHLFEQPVIQTVQMFIGEMGCWIFVGAFTVYAKYIAKKSLAQEGGYQPVNGSDEVPESDAASIRSTTPINPAVKVMVKKEEDRIPLVGLKVLLLALPAICDICGTTLMNVGLLFVEPSIYQMTRGALVLFVGLFSVIFLRRKLYLYQWFALVTVVAGVAVVGLAGWLYHKEDPPESVRDAAILTIRAAVNYAVDELKKPGAGLAVIGVLLIAGAQIFTASQFVLEEYILEKYALEPLKVVGWEGIFGFSVTVLGMIVMYLAVGRTSAGRNGYFDVVEGWREVSSYKGIWVSSIAIMFSIGGFNFFGLSVTRTVSATSRSTIDTCRTLFIWIVSLFLGWETFKWLQVLGFLLLVYGTFLFNGLVRPPLKSCIVRDVEELLPEEPIEHI